ncbi:MAG: CAP domain-containing protein [Syntrophobacteraceae bacterium]
MTIRSGFFAVVMFLVALLPAVTARSSAALLSDGAGVAKAQTRSDRQSLRCEIPRQRVVRFDPESLFRRSNPRSIRLHLFDDLRLTALGREEQNDSNGFLLWAGTIEGVRGARLILAVRDKLLFASIYLPTSIVQIRPVEAMTGEYSRSYLVRQLACPWRNDSPGKTGGRFEPVKGAADAKRVVQLINLERQADGLRPLEYSRRLAEAARRHAMDMAGHDICSHVLSDGKTFYENIFDCGYPSSVVGENLAAGFASPEETFEAMFSSPEHRANILNSRFTQTGVGNAVNTANGYRYFWVQDFGAASAGGGQTMRADRSGRFGRCFPWLGCLF